MKTAIVLMGRTALLILLTTLSIACQKEQFTTDAGKLSLQKEEEVGRELQNILSHYGYDLPGTAATFTPPASAAGPPLSCQYLSCEEAIREANQVLQQQANQVCEEAWGEVVCCIKGMKAFAILRALPTNPKCRKGKKHP